MAEILPHAVQRLVKVFAKLPGVGSRTAMRFVLHLIREGDGALEELSETLNETRDGVTLCVSCNGLTDNAEQCGICRDGMRKNGTLCIVESIADMLSVEGTGLFSGRYFVLHRLLSPLRGIGPEHLGADRLLNRVGAEGIEEVILATPLTTDGETTATYLSRVLTSADVCVTRLAAGVPVGGSIEYLDRMTLTRAFQDRKEL